MFPLFPLFLIDSCRNGERSQRRNRAQFSRPITHSLVRFAKLTFISYMDLFWGWNSIRILCSKKSLLKTLQWLKFLPKHVLNSSSWFSSSFMYTLVHCAFPVQFLTVLPYSLPHVFCFIHWCGRLYFPRIFLVLHALPEPSYSPKERSLFSIPLNLGGTLCLPYEENEVGVPAALWPQGVKATRPPAAADFPLSGCWPLGPGHLAGKKLSITWRDHV